jgi:hypothetical protein
MMGVQDQLHSLMFAPDLPIARPRCTACTYVDVRGQRLSRQAQPSQRKVSLLARRPRLGDLRARQPMSMSLLDD